MNKYKMNIIYNDTDLNINDILIKTLKTELSKITIEDCNK